MVLGLSACEKDEEIIPVPPRSEETPAIAPPEQVPEEIKPPVDLSSELYQSGNFRKMPFRILFPRTYDSTKKYPLLMFLHGMGERGTDNQRQLSIGGAHFQEDSIRESYPAFVVFPQCPEQEYWFDKDVMHSLKGLVDSLVTTHLIDEKRISVGGFSMGAYGTFALVAAYPTLFESAVAISGDGDPDLAEEMSKPTWQVFAGERDDVVSSFKTAKMADALSKAGAEVFFRLYPHADHTNIWQKAFSEPDFFSRLFGTPEKRTRKDAIIGSD